MFACRIFQFKWKILGTGSTLCLSSLLRLHLHAHPVLQCLWETSSWLFGQPTGILLSADRLHTLEGSRGSYSKLRFCIHRL